MLREMTREIVEEVNEIKDLVIKHCSVNMLVDMKDEEFMLMKKVISLVDKSTNLAIKQAEVMDDINSKLDKLLTKNS